MAEARGEEGLHRKLVWLTFFRLVTVTVLLGGAAVVGHGYGLDPAAAAPPLYVVVLATYAASIGIALLLKARRALVAVAYAQILLDTAVAGAVVAVTGYSESVFVVMFSIGIVNGSILLFSRGAAVSAVLALAVYVTLAAGVDPAGRAVQPRVFVHGTALVLIAALAGFLAEQLRRTGERLEAREGALAEITALHESIVQSLGSGLVTIDLAGNVTFMNEAAEQLTGLSAAEVRGRPAATWFSEFRAREPRGEVDWQGAAGRRRLGYSAFPLHGAGVALGTGVIFQDLTELRAMEEAMDRSRRLADLGGVAAGLAHELRNPLASMSGSLELLRATPGISGEDARLMDIVLRESSRLEELVSRFLEFARPPPLRRRDVDLAAVVEETLQVFVNDPRAAGVRLERSLSPSVAWCDPDQLRQVLWNLLVNAEQAVGGKGTIRVSCAPAPEGVRLAVEDDGPGVPAADRASVFMPFFTTKQRGTGLGLAHVQRVADAHGGAVVVEDAPGGGARFVLTLPAAGARVPPAARVR